MILEAHISQCAFIYYFSSKLPETLLFKKIVLAGLTECFVMFCMSFTFDVCL
jgi:hypothetical protein